jgi:hypothetical protein
LFDGTAARQAERSRILPEPMKLHAPVPELPVIYIAAATSAYASQMGSSVDWTYQSAVEQPDPVTSSVR